MRINVLHTAVRNGTLLLATLSIIACQGMDRLERDGAVTAVGADERSTVLDTTAGPGISRGGRLTEEIATRWIRQIEGAGAEERLQLSGQFLQEYPGATVISYLHELVGDAYSELGQPEMAAPAWEQAIEMSWPAPDLLQLPLTNLELPYQVGWARYEEGDPAVGADWLVRAKVVSDRPQLEQGLRFLYSALGSPSDSFDDWFSARRTELAVEAPDFELPGYQTDSVRLSTVDSRLTLINFWTPT